MGIRMTPPLCHRHPSYTSFNAPSLSQPLKDGMVLYRKVAPLPSTTTLLCMCVPPRPRRLSLFRYLPLLPRRLLRPHPPTTLTHTPIPTSPVNTAVRMGHTHLLKEVTIQIPLPTPPPPQLRRQPRRITLMRHSTGQHTVSTTADGTATRGGPLPNLPQGSRDCRATSRATSHLGRRNSRSRSVLWRTPSSLPPSSHTSSRRGMARRREGTLHPPCPRTCALLPAGPLLLGRPRLRLPRAHTGIMEATRRRGKRLRFRAPSRRILLL